MLTERRKRERLPLHFLARFVVWWAVTIGVFTLSVALFSATSEIERQLK